MSLILQRNYVCVSVCVCLSVFFFKNKKDGDIGITKKNRTEQNRREQKSTKQK